MDFLMFFVQYIIWQLKKQHSYVKWNDSVLHCGTKKQTTLSRVQLCFIRFPAVPQYCSPPLTFYKFDTQVSACAAGGLVFSRQEWRIADLPSAYTREPHRPGQENTRAQFFFTKHNKPNPLDHSIWNDYKQPTRKTFNTAATKEKPCQRPRPRRSTFRNLFF